MIARRGKNPEYCCSFCGKPQKQVERLIAGPGAVYICNECVQLCSELIAEGPSHEITPGEVEQHYPGRPAPGVSGHSDISDDQVRGEARESVYFPSRPIVGIIMGSKSDWETIQNAADTLEKLGVPFEVKVVSAHRTPDLLSQYAKSAQSRGLEVIIAGAGGAAHLPGMCASMTPLPVLGVPVESKTLKGIDSLLSIVQMPGGIPVGTLAIGRAGAINAALLAAAILANKYPRLRQSLNDFRAAQTQAVLDHPDPREE